MKEMPKNRIVASKKFKIQLSNTLEYLADFSPQAARNLQNMIKENLRLLELYPRLGKLLGSDNYGERRILIIKKYIVLYTCREDIVHLDMLLDEKLDYYNYI